MTNNSPSRGIWEWNIVFLGVGLSVLLFSFFLIGQGFNEESTRLAIRWSARISVSFFCIAFIASAFHRWQKNSFSWWVFMNRKYFGITFAIIHLLHLGFIFLLQFNFQKVMTSDKLLNLLAGGTAYLFIVLMLLTSFSFFAKMISLKNWKRLHTFGSYWIWIIFMSSYWKRAIVDYEYLPIAILLAGAFFLRKKI